MKKYIVILLLQLSVAVVWAETFNQTYVYPDDNQWRMCRAYSKAKINSNVFSTVGNSAILKFTDCTNFYRFVTDPSWHRIIYGEDTEHVNAYGGYGTSYEQFQTPMSVAVSPNGFIYIADSENYRVTIHFYFSAVDGIWPVASSSTYEITFPSEPIDVCWDDAGDADYVNSLTDFSDCLWILCKDGSVYKYRYAANVTYSIPPPPNDPDAVASFNPNEILYQSSLVNNPRSIARGRAIDNLCEDCDEMGNNNWLYLSEGDDQIKCYTTSYDPESSDLNYEFTYTLPEGTLISSIDVSPIGEIWITDSNNHRILKYWHNEAASTLELCDEWGQWGEGSTTDQLAWPKNVAFAMEPIEDNGEIIYNAYAGMTIAERWSETTGGVNGYQGISIKNLEASYINESTASIEFDMTSYSSSEQLIIKDDEGTQVHSFNFNGPAPGHYEFTWDHSSEISGLYSIEASASSMFDDDDEATVPYGIFPITSLTNIPAGRPNEFSVKVGQNTPLSGILCAIYCDGFYVDETTDETGFAIFNFTSYQVPIGQNFTLEVSKGGFSKTKSLTSYMTGGYQDGSPSCGPLQAGNNWIIPDEMYSLGTLTINGGSSTTGDNEFKLWDEASIHTTQGTTINANQNTSSGHIILLNEYGHEFFKLNSNGSFIMQRGGAIISNVIDDPVLVIDNKIQDTEKILNQHSLTEQNIPTKIDNKSDTTPNQFMNKDKKQNSERYPIKKDDEFKQSEHIVKSDTLQKNNKDNESISTTTIPTKSNNIQTTNDDSNKKTIKEKDNKQ